MNTRGRARQQEAVEVGDAQPLQVDDVGRRGVGAQAAHPGHVLGESQAAAAGRLEAAARSSAR